MVQGDLSARRHRMYPECRISLVCDKKGESHPRAVAWGLPHAEVDHVVPADKRDDAG